MFYNRISVMSTPLARLPKSSLHLLSFVRRQARRSSKNLKMPAWVAVKCTNRSVSTQPRIQQFKFLFHDRPRLQQFVANVRRMDWEPTQHCQICAHHFEEECFRRDDMVCPQPDSDCCAHHFSLSQLIYKSGQRAPGKKNKGLKLMISVPC
ncbi:hypothetical protein J4Q44_G00255940 [Coregonus suidteri]|uniref:THAP-type domain-containing protein n=1 Tax=Coregonus suidteri TaxID=861788 RepID=A0AAN8QFY6_9TELE